ncbi:MAG: hypothetical protein IT377_27760 [Polyangiaceae bacterium]|nr:hypothetical protein [Polyangiaceae bacterium]
MILRAVVVQVLDLLEADPQLAARVRGVFGRTEASTTPKLLDRAGLATALGTSPATLDRLRGEPGFPEVRLGDVPRFELELVVRWLRDRARPDADNVVPLRRGSK